MRHPPAALATSSGLPSPSSLRGIFVAGTDTGVGKTLFASALLRHARNQGRRLIPFKPVETGADPRPHDADRLHEAAEVDIPIDEVCLYRFPLPAAPQAAAAAAGTSISAARIVEAAHRLAAYGDGVVVESAGGLLAPYAPDLTGADLARLLGLPVLLVGRTALGTINHVALSINEIRRRQLPLLGLVLTNTQPERSPHEPTNVSLIHQITGVRCLGTLPYLEEPTPAQLANALQDALGPEGLSCLLAPFARPA